MIRTSTNILLIRNGKILLSRRQNKGWGDGMLCIPGGHIESGETPRQGAIRELREETGLIIKEERLKFYCVAQRRSGEHEYVAYEFFVELKPNEKPKNTEPDECSELVWVNPEKLLDDVIDDFKQIIEKGFIEKEKYLEIGY